MRMPFLRCLVLVLAAVLACTGTAAEPIIHAPQLPVPVGGLCIVRVEGLAEDASFSWQAVPEDTQTADLMQRDGTPVLFVATNRPGVVHLVLGYSDAGKVYQKLATVTIGGGPGPGPIPPGPGPGPTPVPPGPTPPPEVQATAVTYVYEKDQHAIPVQVLSALNKLNRERGIVATVLEADPDDGTGEVPEQYKAALAAAKAAGLPCLVVAGTAGVIRVVKSPTTEQAVLDAVPPPPAMRKAG